MSKKKITQNLTFWVLISIFLGVLLGHFAPDWALYSLMDKKFTYSFLGADISMGPSVSELLSGFFISLVKLFIHPIIFLTISLGIVNMGNLKKVGRVGGKALLYFNQIQYIKTAVVDSRDKEVFLVDGSSLILKNINFDSWLLGLTPATT
jgi:aerobic C4-dicarboxylate transport protein